MAIKLEFHAIKGMLRDLTRSKFSPEFAFDAYNIRLTAREGNTLLSVTNEKGTKECILKDSTGETTIKGDYVGHCVLNNYLVLFTVPLYGYGNIYRLENKGDYFEVFKLYGGKLNLDTDYPIETLGVYETEEVLKVYWTDNKNPIRFINITRVYQEDTNFNLVKTIDSINLTIYKKQGYGNFHSGVILYALTYYNLYGSETNIFAISDLNYCSFENRGASPEETVNCSFELGISTSYKIRTEYDYIRVYSIHRTSLDATPEVKIIGDIDTKNIPYYDGEEYLLFIDNGTVGSIVDPTILLYIGGENLVAKTLTSKDNTLFAGNIKLHKKIIPETIRNELKNCNITFGLSNEFRISDYDTVYSNKNQLDYSSKKIKGFKARECYRFGILFKSEEGAWSEVVFIKDATCNISPNIKNYYNENYSSFANLLIPIASTIIPSNIVRLLINNGYISMRGVCVYPDFNDRNVVCLGVLCPTVFNILDRCDNSPYAQSSWFTRPNPCDNSWKSEYISEGAGINSSVENPIHNVIDGEVLYFQHLEPIWGDRIDTKNLTNEFITRKLYNITRNEVQTSDFFITSGIGQDLDYVGTNRGSFGVDSGIVTMYSPDIEFDNSVGYLKDANLKFRIIGVVMMANTLSDISITTTTTGYYNDVGFIGNPIKNLTINYSIRNKNKSGRGIATAPFWSALPKTDGDKDIKVQHLWPVYPWHRSGSLIASGVPEEGEKRLWELKRKIMSNLWISSHTIYFDSYYEPHSGISPINIWHSGDNLIKIKAINNPNRGFYTYYGDVDKVISYNAASNEKVADNDSNRKANGYGLFLAPTANTDYDSLSKVFNDFNNRARKALNRLAFERVLISYREIYLKTKDAVGVEPVSMKYKSGPHAVFAFNYINKTLGDGTIVPMLYILPNNGYNKNDNSSSGQIRLWDESLTSYVQDTLTFDNPTNQAFLWLGELYRESVTNRFGGNSEEAILNNTWEVAGREILLETVLDLEVTYSGDTYVQRYDALRTYEYTSEDTNSIVDILSFICETRINIDGRYDRNRGNISNLTITPLNFNLLNPVYNQRDNYFNYHTLNYKKFSNNYFPNTIVWSKEKSNAEEIDTWSNLNMLSSLDLDGDKGEIESLNTFNNEIYCFQKKGLSNILFNSRVQIPVSDGVPIEMTNGLKVNGKRYISNTIGCSNKWSIAETPAGLYFIDNETNSLYLFNGLIQSLSDKLGFRLWIGENNSHEQWDPINYKNFRTYYDKNNDDIYFINDKTCLCYSELLNLFTSFMSYEKVPAMFNINSEFYSFNKGKLWHNFEGDYNMFYGEFKPYSITVVANSDEPYDKIFNTVEFRSDSWSGNVLINHATFDTLEVWNEYLYGKSNLATILGHPSTLKKKFRIWRANVPRDTSNHRDRIRNTWAYVKLSMNTANTWRTEFHDMNIHYFI